MYDKLFERRGLSFERLRSLIEVAGAGGIAKAVGDDPVRQSQYSRQLKELEQYFGAELTCRKGKSLTLTPAGRRLAAATRASFASLCDIRSELANVPMEVTIGAGEALQHWILVDAVGVLRGSWPQVLITLVNSRTTAVVDALSEHSLDFGLVRSNAVPKTLRSKIVGHLDYRFFVPHSLRLKLAPEDPERLLTKAPLAMLEGGGDYTQHLMEVARRLRAPLNIGLVCTTLPQVCRAVRSGAFAGVLPTLASAELPTDKYAVYNLPALKSLRRPLALCWHPRLFAIRENSERLIEDIAQIVGRLLCGCAMQVVTKVSKGNDG
jgi:DNA-binding transcriptional LysR family regulator